MPDDKLKNDMNEFRFNILHNGLRIYCKRNYITYTFSLGVFLDNFMKKAKVLTNNTVDMRGPVLYFYYIILLW